jgi:hypothetical protein
MKSEQSGLRQIRDFFYKMEFIFLKETNFGNTSDSFFFEKNGARKCNISSPYNFSKTKPID